MLRSTCLSNVELDDDGGDDDEMYIGYMGS